MKNRHTLITLLILTLCYAANAQHDQQQRGRDYADITVGVGSYKGSLSLSSGRIWKLGKKRKLAVGFGVRVTSFLGANQYYITAPAELTSESNSPLIFFKENIPSNIDSLLVKSPQVNAFNICIALDYTLIKRLTVGFNIDAIGFSFGGTRTGNYINGIQGKNTTGKPTSFNALLISDNDKGTLNSELFAKYTMKEKWVLKAGVQFLFTEYTTITNVQQLPKENNRFRNKALQVALGISYTL